MRDLEKMPDDAVLSFKDWTELANISTRTGKRLRRKGDAPHFFLVSPKRLGTTVGEYRRWLAFRTAAPSRAVV